MTTEDVLLITATILFMIPRGSRWIASFVLVDILLFWVIHEGYIAADYFKFEYIKAYIAGHSVAVLALVVALFYVGTNRKIEPDGYSLLVVSYGVMAMGNFVGIYSPSWRPVFQIMAMVLQFLAMLTGAASGYIHNRGLHRVNFFGLLRRDKGQ